MVGGRSARRRLFDLRPRFELVRPGQRRLSRRAPAHDPLRRLHRDASRVPPEQSPRRRVPLEDADQPGQPQLRAGRSPALLRHQGCAPPVCGRRLPLRPGSLGYPSVVGAVRDRAHEPLALARGEVAPHRGGERPAARRERVERRRVRAGGNRDRRGAGHAEGSVPARVLQRAFAQRAVLQRQGRVLRHRHVSTSEAASR